MKKNMLLILLLIIIKSNIKSINVNESIERLMKNDSTLKFLSLSEHYLDSKTIRMLGKGVEKNTYLRTLDVSRNFGDSKGAIALAEVLKRNRTLKTLDLSGNSIGVRGTGAIAKALKTNSSLVTLDLSRNHVYAKGAIMLAKALHVNRTLNKLNLSHNNIGDRGTIALVDYLQLNNSLTAIDLSYNNISDEGIMALAKLLKLNTSLITLDLSWNNISINAVKALSEALLVNRTLKRLSLSGNDIDDEAVILLARVLQINTSLTKLYLSWNDDISFEAHAKFEDIDFYLLRNKSITSLQLDFLSAFYKEISGTIKLKGITFNEEFVKIRLGLEDIKRLNDLSSAELLLLLKWTYSDIYWDEDDIYMILDIVNNLELRPIPLDYLYRIDNIKNIELTFKDVFLEKEYEFILKIRSKLIRNMLKDTLEENRIPLYEMLTTSRLKDSSNIDAYRIFIYFLYTDKLKLDGIDATKILFDKILELAEFYQVSEPCYQLLKYQLDIASFREEYQWFQTKNSGSFISRITKLFLK